jgi:hypothetical protein
VPDSRGLVPAIHVFPAAAALRRGCPGQSPGMTKLKALFQ